MNSLLQHLRREIFSKADLRRKRGNSVDFKGKFRQPDREFESDPLRQLVYCFSREIPLSEIVTTVPRVSPAKVDVNGRRERSLENGAALWVANSPFGNSAVWLGAAEITTHYRELARVYDA